MLLYMLVLLCALCILDNVDKRCTQETEYPLGWEDKGVVVISELADTGGGLSSRQCWIDTD